MKSLETLKQKKVRLFAAHLKGKNAYDLEDYTGDTAFLIGNEANGLTMRLRLWRILMSAFPWRAAWNP